MLYCDVDIFTALVDSLISLIMPVTRQGMTRDAIDGNGSGSGSGNGSQSDDESGSRRTVHTARGCTYNEFLNCQLLNYKGIEGANSHVRTIGINAVNEMSWREIMKLITEAYCSRNEIQKLEGELWNLTVKGTDVVDYTQCFQELALLCPRMVSEEEHKDDPSKDESIDAASDTVEPPISPLLDFYPQTSHMFLAPVIPLGQELPVRTPFRTFSLKTCTVQTPRNSIRPQPPLPISILACVDAWIAAYPSSPSPSPARSGPSCKRPESSPSSLCRESPAPSLVLHYVLVELLPPRKRVTALEMIEALEREYLEDCGLSLDSVRVIGIKRGYGFDCDLGPHSRRWIRRIRNFEYAFSCEELALICRISFPGYGVLVRNRISSNVFVLAPKYAPFNMSS
nr:hypothetical protein [Tanacetum cinerariifolium]